LSTPEKKKPPTARQKGGEGSLQEPLYTDVIQQRARWFSMPHYWLQA